MPKAKSRPVRNASPSQAALVLQALLVRPIAYHRPFASIGGSLAAGVFLSQAWYWSPRATNADGWFYKTQAEWEEETGLTRYEQETARRNLRDRGLIEEKKKGIPARLFFRVNVEQVVEALTATQLLADADERATSADKDAEIPHTGVGKSSTQAWGKATGYYRDYAETTQKPHTHRARAQRAADGGKAAGVRVASRFTLKQCRTYADHLKQEGITNPGGYATTIHRSGEADEHIAAFLEPKQPKTAPVKTDHAGCPRCFGSGMEVVKGKGARRCTWQPTAALRSVK